MTIPITSARVSLRFNIEFHSEEMRREHVNDRRNHEKEEQRHMKCVPELKETFIQRKGRSLLDGRNM